MSEFDSNAYWRERHEQYRENTQGVGNIVYSQHDNDEIYRQAQHRLGMVLDALELGSEKSVLDLGCGIGMMVPPFLEREFDYIGVDISPTAIEIASHRYPKARFLCEDIASIQLSQRFNLVLERTVFIHLVDDFKWKQALRAVSTHLHKDGLFLIHDKIGQEPEQPADHVIFRSESQWAEALYELGLRFDEEKEASLVKKVATQSLRIVTRS